jgi:hypothetical protein
MVTMVARVEMTSGHQIVKSEALARHDEQSRTVLGDQLPLRGNVLVPAENWRGVGRRPVKE